MEVPADALEAAVSSRGPGPLRGADPSRTRIADVANEWGFWHMGQLAADYRRHFGENPSETLRRQNKR